MGIVLSFLDNREFAVLSYMCRWLYWRLRTNPCSDMFAKGKSVVLHSRRNSRAEIDWKRVLLMDVPRSGIAFRVLDLGSLNLDPHLMSDRVVHGNDDDAVVSRLLSSFAPSTPTALLSALSPMLKRLTSLSTAKANTVLLSHVPNLRELSLDMYANELYLDHLTSVTRLCCQISPASWPTPNLQHLTVDRLTGYSSSSIPPRLPDTLVSLDMGLDFYSIESGSVTPCQLAHLTRLTSLAINSCTPLRWWQVQKKPLLSVTKFRGCCVCEPEVASAELNRVLPNVTDIDFQECNACVHSKGMHELRAALDAVALHPVATNRRYGVGFCCLDRDIREFLQELSSQLHLLSSLRLIDLTICRATLSALQILTNLERLDWGGDFGGSEEWPITFVVTMPRRSEERRMWPRLEVLTLQTLASRSSPHDDTQDVLAEIWRQHALVPDVTSSLDLLAPDDLIVTNLHDAHMWTHSRAEEEVV